jgi:5'-deoxynucleotidase YfbR-like HD superfamily hydrolase/diadenosine tetraphosphate (Ap4A) HIT family hydrolase
VEDCLVCRQVAEPETLPGGHLWADEHAVAFHIPPSEGNPRPYRGHCLVVVRRHVDHLADLTDEEAASIARGSRAIAGRLRAAGAERTHVAVVGLGVAHFHQHLFPRYPGTPPGTPWHALDEAPGAPQLDADGIAELAEQLRGAWEAGGTSPAGDAAILADVAERERLERIVRLLDEADALKRVERRTWLADESRPENSAEHSWHAALTAIVLHRELEQPVDLGRTLAIIAVHDLVEIDAGDTYAFDAAGAATQREREEAAADRLFDGLPELRELWDEFETGDSREAAFARAVDRLQATLQNLQTGGRVWRENGVTEAMSRERNAPGFALDPAFARLLELLYERAGPAFA